MAKKNEKSSTRIDKEALFDDFFNTADEALDRFERWFHADGVRAGFLGLEATGKHASLPKGKALQKAKDHVRASRAWGALSALYDYAVDGIAGGAHPTDIVIDGAEVLSFINTENVSPLAAWDGIVARGDGRYALDEGEDLYIEKLTLLAEVDIRTVRNAISAGELAAEKRDDLFQPGTYVDNASARRWLQGRRGFKPTLYEGDAARRIEDVSSPFEFGAFLKAQRDALGLAGDDGKLVPLCPGVDAKALSALEAGVFLPLPTSIFRLA